MRSFRRVIAAAVASALIAAASAQEAGESASTLDERDGTPTEAALRAIVDPESPTFEEQGLINEFWMAKLSRAHEVLQRAVEDDPGAPCRLLQAFGRHGARTDFVILFGAMHLNVPVWRKPQHVEGGTEPLKERQLRVCECLTRRLLTDGSFRDRYYAAVMWSREMKLTRVSGLAPWVEAIDEGLHAGGEEYWWHARSLVMLMMVTGQDALLEEADADDLRPLFIRWRAWLDESIGRLVPNEAGGRWVVGDTNEIRKREATGQDSLPFPQKPFPDWVGEVPSPSILAYLPR